MSSGKEKISVGKCKSILEKDGSIYSEQEIVEIREFLYLLAELDYDVYLKLKLRDKQFKDKKENNENFKRAA
jgi:hypothetical protein